MRKTLSSLAMLPILLAASSCMEESLNTGGTPDDNLPALQTVELNLGINVLPEDNATPDVVVPYTRAVDDPDDVSATEIANVWVFQFDGTDDDAVLVGPGSYLEYNSEDLSKNTLRAVASTSANTFVVLANTFNPSFVFKAGSTLAEMKKVMQGVESEKDLFGVGLAPGGGAVFPDDKDYHILFNGYVTATINESTNNIDVDLKRNIARIDFTIKNSTAATSYPVTVKKLWLRNVPKFCNIFTNYDGLESPYPTVGELSVNGMNDNYAERLWEVGTGSENEKSFRFYVPANMRGKSVGSVSAKKPVLDPDGYSTYLFVDATYKDDGKDIPVTYSFYLGENLTDDFNLKPNHAYSYNIELKDKGDSDVDSRVIDWGGKDFTLSSVERANCYILNPPDVEGYMREFILPVDRVDMFWFNTEPVSGANFEYEKENNYRLSNNMTWKVSVLWSDFKITDDVFKITLDQGTGKNAPYKVAVAKGVSGNVVIGLNRSGDPTILWSWHLWITDYDPDSTHESATDGKFIYAVKGGAVHRYKGTMWETGVYKDKFMMDRNLGSESTAYVGSGKGSLYYQFGRKDPFWGGNTVYMGGTEAKTGIETIASGSTYKDGKNVPYSVNNPMKFITGTAWTSGDKYNPDPYVSSILWNDPSTQNSGVRAGQKSLFDPCPPGWRLPTSGVWSDYITQDSDKTTTNIKHANKRSFPVFDGAVNKGLWYYPYVKSQGDTYDVPTVTVFYPASGYRPNSNGGLSYVGSSGYCWTQSPYSTTNGYYLNFNATNLFPTNYLNRAYGFPVRCISE